MVDPATVGETLQREVQASGDDAEHLLSGWLLELLLLTELENVVFGRFEVQIEGGRLTAVAFGEELDLERHEIRGMVKGVTRHMLSVNHEDSGYAARVVFDM
jgi:SHS2 domain-containing protein